MITSTENYSFKLNALQRAVSLYVDYFNCLSEYVGSFKIKINLNIYNKGCIYQLDQNLISDQRNFRACLFANG